MAIYFNGNKIGRTGDLNLNVSSIEIVSALPTIGQPNVLYVVGSGLPHTPHDAAVWNVDENDYVYIYEETQGVEVVDNLESTDTDKALSANMGRVLNEELINLNGELTNLNTELVNKHLYQYVMSIKDSTSNSVMFYSNYKLSSNSFDSSDYTREQLTDFISLLLSLRANAFGTPSIFPSSAGGYAVVNNGGTELQMIRWIDANDNTIVAININGGQVASTKIGDIQVYYVAQIL